MLAKTPRSRVDLAFVTSTPEMLLDLNTPAIISSAQVRYWAMPNILVFATPPNNINNSNKTLNCTPCPRHQNHQHITPSTDNAYNAVRIHSWWHRLLLYHDTPPF